MRRNTDRRAEHRRAQLAFVIAIVLIAKLLDQRQRTEDLSVYPRKV
jgi:hypothetical protein